jgi:hypothetical protein
MTDLDRTSQVPTPDTGPVQDNDTTAVPVPTSTVGAPPPLGAAGTTAPAPAARQSRTRWIAAGAIVALVVGITAIATLALTGSTPTSTVAGYVPADSVMYGELRLDLPGDQRQKVGQFLSKFPGFADQAALDTKLDEVLDRLTSDNTSGAQVYSRDIKPWFDGELAFSVGAIPTSDDPATAAGQVRAVVLLSIKDEALARTWFTNAIAASGATGTPQDYQGVQLTVFDAPDKAATAQAAFALVGGKVAVAGDVASVKAAIDTKGASGLAKGADFAAAQAAITGDSIGFFFMDLQALVDASLEMTRSMASSPPISQNLLALVPDWAGFRMRVEGDALLFDGIMPHTDAAPGPAENRANKVADFAPPSTVLLAAGNDVGATLLEVVSLYRNEPGMAEAFKGIDQAAGMLGGLDAALGWMGDSGVVVSKAGDGVEGGIVSVPSDPGKGKQLLTTLRSFITLGGAQAGITVRDEDYNGTQITIIDLGSASDLLGMAGALGGAPVPTDPGSLPSGSVEIAYATTDAVVIIGSSPDFVKHALDAGAGASLADDARYQGLLGRVGATHTAVNFVDVTAMRGLMEGLLSSATPEERAEYEESVKPFLVPLDAVVATNVLGGELDQSHMLITVK